MTADAPAVSPSLYEGVVAQEAALAQLCSCASAPVHAFLFVGPSGSGRRKAAVGFAASLLCPRGGCGACRTCRLVVTESHPDLVVFEPQGAFLSVRDDAPEIIRVASRSPVEGDRKVIVLTDFERVERAGPALLKTIEEPPESTVFVILAEHVPPELATIASRCSRVEFSPIPPRVIVDELVAEGVTPERAAVVAAASVGSLARARLLASDTHLEGRHRAWQQLPSRLDGTGRTAAVLVDEVLALVTEAAAPLAARHAAEARAVEERVERYGERGSGRKDLDKRHRRELRRHRVDELRFGMATLARRYRDTLPTGSRGDDVVAAVAAIQTAAEAVSRNPNEVLLLQALLLRLPVLAPPGAAGAP